MARQRLFMCGVMAVVLLSALTPRSEELFVRVHLINIKTGMPIPAKRIDVEVWDAHPYVGHLPRKFLRERTNREGLAIFRIEGSMPGNLNILMNEGGYWQQCSPLPYDPDEVVSRGANHWREIGGLDREPRLRAVVQSFEPKPGEVYVFASHLTFFERLSHCGHWGCHC